MSSKTRFRATVDWHERSKGPGGTAREYRVGSEATVWETRDAAIRWACRYRDALPVTALRVTCDVSSEQLFFNAAGTAERASAQRSVWEWSDIPAAEGDTVSAMYAARQQLEDALGRMAARSRDLDR